MPDEPPKIIVDDDWKAEARREKERLAEQEQKRAAEAAPPTSGFLEIVNLLVMQVLVGLGAVAGPGGERIPPNLPAARYFIDLLEALEQKTQNNLTPEEKRVLEQVLYEMRMSYVSLTQAISGAVAPGAPGAGNPAAAAPATGQAAPSPKK